MLEDESKQLIHADAARDSRTLWENSGVSCDAQGADTLTFLAWTLPEADLQGFAAVQAEGDASEGGGGLKAGIATDEENREMLNEIWGAAPELGPGVDEDRVATDAEVDEMLNDVFGAA